MRGNSRGIVGCRLCEADRCDNILSHGLSSAGGRAVRAQLGIADDRFKLAPVNSSAGINSPRRGYHDVRPLLLRALSIAKIKDSHDLEGRTTCRSVVAIAAATVAAACGYEAQQSQHGSGETGFSERSSSDHCCPLLSFT